MIQKVSEFCQQHIDTWFINKLRPLYVLYLLNSIIAKLPLPNIQSLIGTIIEMMQGKSSPDLREMGCLVIENLFTARHIQTEYAKSLLGELIAISQQQFYSARSEQQVMALVQAITQVYLNLNRGVPYEAKELLYGVLDSIGDLISLESEQSNQLKIDSLKIMKTHATKSLELILVESCDDYLFNEDEEFSLFSNFSLTQQENVIDNIREQAGLEKKGKLSPKQALFVTLKDFVSLRYEKSIVFVLQILNSFLIRLGQLGYGTKPFVTDQLIELMITLKQNYGFSEETVKVLGKLCSSCCMQRLFNTLPLMITEVDLMDPEFEDKSNSFILALLGTHKKHGRFGVFYQNAWKQFKSLKEKIETQKAFLGTAPEEKLILHKYQILQSQLIQLMKNCDSFVIKDSENLSFYFEEILEMFLNENDIRVLELIVVPLRECLIFSHNNRNEIKEAYQEILECIKKQGLLAKLCKTNNKVPKNITFIEDCIRIMVLMTPQETILRIATSNIERLSKFFLKPTFSQDKAILQRNLRDLDTVSVILSCIDDLQNNSIFEGVFTFAKQLMNTPSEGVWKRGVYILDSLLHSVDIKSCEAIFIVVEEFFSAKFNTKQLKKPKNITPMMTEESGSELILDESKRKLKDIMIKFLKTYVEQYFLRMFAEHKKNDPQSAMHNLGSETQGLTAFAIKYLPLAMISMKSRTSKTREISKTLLIKIDEAYEAATSEPTFLLNQMLAGLAGKTSLMKSTTVLAIGLIFAKRHRSLEPDYVERLIEIILLMVKEKNKETYKAVVAFFKYFARSMNKNVVLGQIRLILSALFEWDEESHEKVKNTVRTVMQTLHRRLVYNNIISRAKKL